MKTLVTLKDLREYIKDLPDDLPIGGFPSNEIDCSEVLVYTMDRTEEWEESAKLYPEEHLEFMEKLTKWWTCEPPVKVLIFSVD